MYLKNTKRNTVYPKDKLNLKEMKSFKMVAKTFKGLEEVLAKELIEIGADNVQLERRAVSFTGDLSTLYKANIHLRTASRILKPIFEFKAEDADDLYEKIKTFNWENHLTTNSTFSIDATVYSDSFKHSKFVTYRVKDAIADYFMEKYNKRPSVRLDKPELILNIHIAQNHCTLSLDSSGNSLHKRGYRVSQNEAPLNEALAAGMILLTGWQGETDFIDPMCGSGTLLIEAALIALNIPPGIYRQEYAFETWNDFDQELFEQIFNDDSNEREFTHKIYGSDSSPRAIKIAEQNIKSAGLSKYIQLEVKNVLQFEKPSEKCLMVTNPPYGERITSPDIFGLYSGLGTVLKHQFTGSTAWIISSHEECLAKIGMRPDERIDLLNGSLECKYCKYTIFEGKRNEFLANREEKGSDKNPRRSGRENNFRTNSKYRGKDERSRDSRNARPSNRFRDRDSKQGDDRNRRFENDNRGNRRGDKNRRQSSNERFNDKNSYNRNPRSTNRKNT